MDAEMDVTTDGGGAPEPGGLAAPEELAADRLKAERVQEALFAAVAGRLKAERVQQALSVAAELAGRLKAERVQDALATAEFAAALAGRREGDPAWQELAQGPLERLQGARLQCVLDEVVAGWRASADDRTILRRFRFPLLRAAMAFTTLVGELAATFHHQPQVRIYGNDVLVTFATPGVDGVTFLDIAMARAVSLLDESSL